MAAFAHSQSSDPTDTSTNLASKRTVVLSRNDHHTSGHGALDISHHRLLSLAVLMGDNIMRHAFVLAPLVAGALLALAVAVAVRGDRAVAATSALLPDLRAMPAHQLSITNSPGQKYLRLSATSWNGGAGRLHLVGGATDPATGTQEVYQRVFNDDGSYQDYLAGEFVWHPLHNHTHFGDYAAYILDPVTTGIADRIANKTTFCIIDTTAIDLTLPGAPQSPQYLFCNAQYQGLSVGWGDTYTSDLAGQEINITGLPDGDYYLTIDVDPDGRILESNDSNNASTIVARITGDSVSIVLATPTPTPTPTQTATPTETPTEEPGAPVGGVAEEPNLTALAPAATSPLRADPVYMAATAFAVFVASAAGLILRRRNGR